MAKKKAEWENKSRFKHARSAVAVGIVLVLAAALILTGVLMTVIDRGDGVATVSAINLESERIGMTADLDKVFVKILYSDGSARNVALSELMPEGLDLTYAGRQTVTINYGNQQWSLPVEVVSSKIKIEYVTSDGGYIEGDAYQEIPAGESGATVRAVPNEGYYFDGWDDGVIPETRHERAVSQHRTIRAIFKRNAYTVAFQRADGRWDEQTVYYGDPAVPPDSNTWKMRNYGYKFLQWDKSVADGLTSVTRDLLVRGEYEQYHSKFSVSVTGNPDNIKDRTVSAANHTFGSDVQTEDKNSSVSYVLDGKSYTRRANVYTGFYEWQASPASVIAVNAAQDSVLDCWLVKMSNGNWQKIEVGGSAKVLLPGSGGDESDMSEFSAAAAENGVYKLTFTLQPLQDKDAILEVVAVMEYERNDILFYNRADHVKTVALPYASTLTAEDFPVLEMTGYDFDGWFIRNSETEVTAETYFKEKTIVDAHWTPKQYTVNFTIPEEWQNKGCGFAPIEFTKEYLSTLGRDFPPHSPECDGYDFAGWFVEGVTGGSAVTEATVVSSNMTLVPSFTPKRHTVRFEIKGGNGRVYAAKDGGTRETVGSGTYIIEEPSSYVFSVEWDAEYRFASLSVDGEKVILPITDTDYSFVLNFNKNGSDGAYRTDKERTVEVNLANSRFGLSFVNGSGGVKGTVAVAGDYGGTFADAEATLDVPMHAQVLYTVTAPKGYVINTLTVDGTAVDISANSSEYTGLIGDYRAEHTVTVTYAERTFNINIQDGDTEKTETVNSESPFVYEITAPADKYAAKVTINGRSVDLYRFEAAGAGGYYIDRDSLRVNMRGASADEIEKRDGRVTKATVKIDEVAEDADIVIEYADLEYTLTFGGEGYGTVLSDATVKVKRNEGWVVVLSTETGYYVAGYRVSSYDKAQGTVKTATVDYNSFAADYTEEITNVTEDADYTFIFARRTFGVIFGVSGGSLNIVSGGETAVLSGSALKDYSVQYGASVRYSLSVADNMRIEGVRLISDGGAVEELETGTVESNYELVLDKITDGYRVIVTVSAKPTVKGDGGLAIEKTVGGKVTAPMGDSYTAGQALELTVIAESGYEIRSVVVSSPGRFSRAVSAQSIVNGKFTVSSADTASAGGAEIKVSPVFAPKNFDVTLSIGGSVGGRYDGEGKIAVGPEKDSAADKVTVVGGTSTESVAYGSNYYVYFIAGADSIISEIKVDGVHVELNSSNLEDYTMTAPDGGYSAARISVRVSGETTVSAVFRKETFNVTVANSYNGTTEIVNASGGFLKGEDVLIGMTADTGYHITGLYIDGIKIDESLYLNFSGDDAKLNTAAKYTYGNISRNVTVVAQYEMNYYSLGFTAVNTSPNFKEVNTAFGSYAALAAEYSNGGVPTLTSEIDGRANYNATFANIAHGSTVELNIRAAYTSGYYIKKLTIHMLSGDVGYDLITEDGTLHVFDECYATGNIYSATVGIRGRGGITADVYSVSVEFTRAEYRVRAFYGEGASSDVGISFVNSYNNGQAAIYGTHTDVSGEYYVVEFGIQATVMVTPTEKFRLSQLLDGEGYDYTYNVIGNRYTGLISRNVSFFASYEVRQMNITLTVGGEAYGSANIDGFSGNTATLPYGSELRLILIPETASGGIIDALRVNGAQVTLTYENGVYYYVIDELTADIDAQAFFELEKFRATQSVNVTAGGSVALTDGAGNHLNNNEIPWGDTLSATITVNRAYNLVSVRINGTNYDIGSLRYEEMNGIRRYGLEIQNVQSNYAIAVSFELKTFDWNADYNAVSGDVYIADTDGRRLSKLTANDDVYLYVKPSSGYMVSSVSARMQGFDGNFVNLALDAEYVNEDNLDERRYLIEDITGIVTVAVEFGQKEFTVKIDSIIGADGFEIMTLTVKRGGVITGVINLDRWNSSVVTNVRFGDTVTLSVKAREGYDIMGVSVNGKEYLAGNNNSIYYTVSTDTYTWENAEVNDNLVNNRDENGKFIIGGNAAYELKFTMASERDSFEVRLSGSYDGIADVSVSDRMSYGSRNNIIITAHEGYGITSVYISSPKEYASGQYDMIPYHLERVSELRFDLIVDGTRGVFNYHSNTGVMDKFICIEINADINSYNQSVSEYVHDNDKVTTDVSQSSNMIASHTKAYYINKEGEEVPLRNATSVDHFLEVTVETNAVNPQEYEFWGFQEYVAGRGWIGEIENITYAGGSANKFTYIVDKARSFRAVYVRRYTVGVEIIPFHKYLSGSYIPETGTFMSYSTYGAIGAAITDPFGLGTSNAENVSSDNANYIYEVCYGDALSITASDSNTQNRSRSVNYYAEENGELKLLSSGSMGMSLTVDKNMRIYAAYDNNIQFAMTTETVGGEKAGEGATVEYSVGGSLRVMQNNAFAVNAFDKVTVKVTLQENYRFDGLLALEAQNRGDIGTLIWTSTWDTLFDFSANGTSGVVNDCYPSDKITHKQDGNVITFEFTVTENAIYKLVLHRMFTIEISENDGYDADGNPETVDGGASLGTVTNNRAPEGWYDYGSTVQLTSEPVGDAQFVGWFVNGKNYFDLSSSLMWNNDAAETHSFTLSGDRVSGAKNLDIRAEYLPIYTLNIYRGLETEDADGNKIKFFGSTNLTSVNAVQYRQSSVNITMGSAFEAEENFDIIGNSMEMLTHVVSFAEKDNLSKVSNKIVLTVRPNASFVFSNWSVKIGESGVWNEIESSNSTEFTFDLVAYLYGKYDADEVKTLPRDIHFRANITKNNVIRVSKVVYYDAFGVISPSNGLADNRAYVGDINTQTVSTVEYGTEVSVSVQAGRDYRFLGWYDITKGYTNSITEIGDRNLEAIPDAGTTYTLKLEKGASETAPVEGYTYYLEARFMREVTVTFAVENNSANGNESFKYQVPVIKGTAAKVIQYAGNTAETVDTSDIDTSTAAAPSLRHTVTMKMNAGTYVAFVLPSDISKDGFSPDNHKYLGLSAGSYVERGGDGEYYVMFDRNRTITVLYGAYGTINLEDILPYATVTFGEVFTNLYLDQHSAVTSVETLQYSLSVSGGRLKIVNKTNGNITVPLTDMPKVDYQTDKSASAAASYEKVDVHVNPMTAGTVLSYDISVGFSYGSEENMTLAYSLTDFGQMPFASGAGTSANPYIISNVEQLKNVGRVYELSGNTFGTTYRYFAMETKMRNGSDIPATQKFMYLNEDGEDWTPLCSGQTVKGFDGVFDFKDWEIGGLTGTVTDNYFGVFAKLNGATIRSLNFGGKNNVTGSADYVGFITGYAINTTFEDINVKDNQTRFLDGNTSVGTIGTTGNYLGLVAGYAESCTINGGIYIYSATVAGGGEVEVILGDTYFRKGLYVGAMFGYLKNTDIGTTSNNMVLTVNNVTVGGHRYVGGVAGYFDGPGKTVQGASLISGTFGTQNVSGDVGGLLGYVVAGATVKNVSAPQSSDSNSVTVNGIYRYISDIDIENNYIEQYLYDNTQFANARGASSIGGLIGRLDGTLDTAEIGGIMQIYGSVAGGMVGFNKGTVKNLKLADTGRVTFDLRYGGAYGGMVGYNEGLVSYAVIGRLNKYQGLSEDMGRLINRESSDMVSGANVVFKTEGSASGVQGSGSTSIYSPASGKLFDEWGGLAMGGAVGYNVSKVYNSVTYGKIVHYKKVNGGSSMLDALGGIVGMNRGTSAEVRACGTSYGIVLDYTVVNVSNQMQSSHSVAAGGVIGSHSGGIALALFSFHSAVSSFTNAGIPGEGGYVASVLRVAAGVGGLLAAVPGTATAQSNISWGYYNEKSFNGDYFGAFVLGSSNAVSSQTLGASATNLNAQNMSGYEPSDARFNVLPTDYNYNTYVNGNNGNVFNIKAKAATLGNFRYAAAEDVTRAGYRVRDYYNEYAKVYAVNDDGRPTSTLVPWQYDSDNNR